MLQATVLINIYNHEIELRYIYRGLNLSLEKVEYLKGLNKLDDT